MDKKSILVFLALALAALSGRAQDRGERYIIKNTKTFLESRRGEENFLYICVGNEPQLLPEIEAFLKILEEVKPQGLTWKYIKMPEESHVSILVRSLTESLRAFASK
jgi:hypothetical protein